jgi:hypothetical protein
LHWLPNAGRSIKLNTMRYVGNVTCMGEARHLYSILIGKLEGKRPFGRPRGG